MAHSWPLFNFNRENNNIARRPELSAISVSRDIKAHHRGPWCSMVRLCDHDRSDYLRGAKQGTTERCSLSAVRFCLDQLHRPQQPFNRRPTHQRRITYLRVAAWHSLIRILLDLRSYANTSRMAGR